MKQYKMKTYFRDLKVLNVYKTMVYKIISTLKANRDVIKPRKLKEKNRIKKQISRVKNRIVSNSMRTLRKMAKKIEVSEATIR